MSTTLPWLNLSRRAGALGGVKPEPLATGFRRLGAGVVDADVALEMGQPRNLLRAKCPGTSVFHVPSCYNNRRFRASITAVRLQVEQIQLVANIA